jgi:hypothetical protein
VVALQPPQLAQDLRPFEQRLDRDAHAGKVDVAGLARALGAGLPSSGVRVASMARSRVPWRSSSVCPSAATVKLSACAASVFTSEAAKSKTSIRPGVSLWPPRPCAPAIGSVVQTTLPRATPAIWP